jgi:uncharacterized repeat protein (TIGR03837 family)
MNTRRLWDIFCTVIDNHGDLGVCWRLARQLAQAGQSVRLWVDDASALAWMAPDTLRASLSDIQVLPWADACEPELLACLPAANIWIEAFGCTLPEAFVSHAAATRKQQPAWINLEYLSAESWVPRLHGLPSPVMSGPAKGWSKRFFYPGFMPDTGGLLRETDLIEKHLAFSVSGQRTRWRAQHAPHSTSSALLISLFCYEPAALPQWLDQRAGTPHRLLVTPGRPMAAVQQIGSKPSGSGSVAALNWSALAYTDQDSFDEMLWACDLNFVRGEDSLVRALWAGQPFVWHIYPQEDLAHHAKLEAFLDWLNAPQSLRQFHRVWNGMEEAALPSLNEASLSKWGECVMAARQRLLSQDDLRTQLITHSATTSAAP